MLPMGNVKNEYKKIVMHKKRNKFFFVSLKNEILFFLTRDYIFLLGDNKNISP